MSSIDFIFFRVHVIEMRRCKNKSITTVKVVKMYCERIKESKISKPLSTKTRIFRIINLKYYCHLSVYYSHDSTWVRFEKVLI